MVNLRRPVGSLSCRGGVVSVSEAYIRPLPFQSIVTLRLARRLIWSDLGVGRSRGTGPGPLPKEVVSCSRSGNGKSGTRVTIVVPDGTLL